MARNRQQRTYTAEEARTRMDWFASTDSDASTILEWDIKRDVLVEAILEVLQAGDAVMFGRSMDGGAISVTIYSGEAKSRKWVGDSIELDDLMNAVVQRGRAARTNMRHIPVRASGD
jgi:hypothetical protein